ncbi:hypothetical protein [Lysobacter arvi]|uniref:hypothetical protein n=1 Tax=Lysobacter arvi TaxID=3038776 RepID=UPI00283AADEC|nr:hypothetical protein [Lysobacter arvi]
MTKLILNRGVSWLLWLALAFVLITVTVWLSPLRGTAMDDEKIMMYPGDGLFGEPFDATGWFANGMYRRNRYADERVGFSNTGMTRVAPPPFPDWQLEDLRIWIAMGLEQPTPGGRVTPQAAIDQVGDPSFDPRHQIIYQGSGFIAPDEPTDGYAFYMLHDGKRYFVALDRDPISGKITSASRAISLGPRELEERLFEELETRRKLAAWRNAPGLRASSGQPCPYPGVWECLDCTPGGEKQRKFAHEAILPQVDGRDVTWRMVRGHQ